MKVFIVDDSEHFRNSLVSLLLDITGVNIAGQAGDVNQAMEGIGKTRPEVVILDIRMPGGTGLDVLKNIKTAASAPIVIIFTNYPVDEYRKVFAEAGADYFFDKSSESEKLIDLIKKLVSKKIKSKDAV